MKHQIAVTVEHANKSFGDLKAVDDLSFSVFEARCCGFLGPNGAGKTTMMKMLYAKALPDRSPKTVIDVFGLDPRRDELRIKSLSGVAPQDDDLDEELSVIQNLRIFARLQGLPKVGADDRIDELLGFMELGGKTGAKIRELSGGMRRRLIIVRALLNDPQLLILDEPTTGLDPQVRQLIWDKLRGLKHSGVTILLTTHYMEEAFQIADEVVIMDKGKKVLEGNPVRLVETQIEPYVLELLNKEAAAGLERRWDGSVRKEEAAERMLYYGGDQKTLEKMTSGLSPDQYYLRKTNLEDLFLRATGRNLSAGQ